MNLEHRPDHAVNWPRAVQSSVAILGALTFGAIAYGYGYGVSSGRTESYSQAAPAADGPIGFICGDSAMNQPSGLTQIAYFNGTSKDWDTATTIHAASDTGIVSNFGAAYTTRWSVFDSSASYNPLGHASGVLRQEWNVGDGDGYNGILLSDFRDLRGDTTEFREVYRRFVFRYSDNWEFHSGNEKLNFLGTAGSGGNPSEFFVQPRGAGTDAWDNQSGTAGSDNGYYYINGWTLVAGTWYTVELWMGANTTSVSGDGFLHMWLNGVKVDSLNDLGGDGWVNLGDSTRQWTTYTTDSLNLFGGSQWFFWGGSGDTKTVEDHIDWAEYCVGVK